MKKLLISMVIINILLVIMLFYVLTLRYYDNYYDKNGNWHNEEHQIIELVRLVIKEQGGIIAKKGGDKSE